MVPIRKGDGTGLSVPGFKRVKTGDGRVFYEDTIPNSVIIQHFATTYSVGDAVWVDDTGTADMSISGDPQKPMMSDGSEAVEGDGNDDYGAAPFPSALDGSGLNAFSVEFSYEHNGGITRVFEASNSSGNQRIQCLNRLNESGSFEDGTVRLQITDDSGSTFAFAPQNNPGLDDGNRHDISFIVNDASQNDANIFIDGSEVAVAVGSAGSPSNFVTWDVDLAYFAANDRGTIENISQLKIGAVRWHDEAISEQTIADYPRD